MAFGHGKDAVFKLDNAAGSLIDISAFLTSATLPFNVETAEVTTFGDDDKEYIVGLRDATISLEGKFDPTIDAQLDGLRGVAATKTFEFHKQGTGTGLPYYTGEAILTSYEVSADVGSEVTFSAELQVTGAVARNTNP